MLNPETDEKLLQYALWKYGTMTVIVDAAQPSFQVRKPVENFKHDSSSTQAESTQNQLVELIMEIT